MLTSLARHLPLALIGVFALWLRLGELGRRPMHADEANQAVKLGELLETGRYTYDPRDHHGPTLYYAAVPIAWIRGERNLAALTETTVRLVPAIFGTLAVVLLGILAAPLGRWPALAAAALLAASPPAVYYSRYFVQETLLLAFTLGAFVCAREAWRTGAHGWAAAAGACAGLAQATKATAPLFVFAGIAALLLVRPLGAREARPAVPPGRRQRQIAFGLVGALAAAGLLYSSFGTNFAGLRDALAAYGHALARFGRGAAPTGHEKPWWYYLRLFGWWQEGGLRWQQLGFSALAVAGLGLAAITRERLPRWAAGYTAVVATAYSLFAYKTPWQAIHFVPGMALLAAAALGALARLRTGRFVAVPLALLVLVSQFGQSRLAAYRRPADPRNPYAYVHSSPDVLKYRPLAAAALARFPDQPVRVISEEYWPLPWYLRGLPRVGYWTEPPEDCDGALVIASPALTEAVRARMRRTYRESVLGLRPGFLCIVFAPTEGNESGR